MIRDWISRWIFFNKHFCHVFPTHNQVKNVALCVRSIWCLTCMRNIHESCKCSHHFESHSKSVIFVYWDIEVSSDYTFTSWLFMLQQGIQCIGEKIEYPKPEVHAGNIHQPLGFQPPVAVFWRTVEAGGFKWKIQRFVSGDKCSFYSCDSSIINIAIIVAVQTVNIQLLCIENDCDSTSWILAWRSIERMVDVMVSLWTAGIQ